MKKQLLLLLFCWLWASVPLSAYTVLDTSTKEIVDTDTLPTVRRTVEKLSNGIKVTYEFSGILLVRDSLVANAYHPIIEGFGSISTEGDPWLPIKCDRFSISDTTDCTVQVLEREYFDAKFQVSPARAPHLNSEDFVYTSENLPPVINRNNLYPTQPLVSNGGVIYRDLLIRNVVVCPISYHSLRKLARISKKISYLVEDTGSELVDAQSERIDANDPIIGGLCNNEDNDFAKVAPLRYGRPAPASYLIISHASLDNDLNAFVHWKQRMGYNVEWKSDKTWTPEKIKATVKDFYARNPHAYYLLLVGDHSLVPAEPFKNMADTATLYSDLHYACMDGDDDRMPDLYYGRIPASTPSELTAVIDKIIKFKFRKLMISK